MGVPPPTLLYNSIDRPLGLDYRAATGELFIGRGRNSDVWIGDVEGASPLQTMGNISEDETYFVSVDEASGKLYMTSRLNGIVSTNLDGSGISTLIHSNPLYYTGIDYDPVSQKIFFAEYYGDIYSINTDGSGAVVIYNTPGGGGRGGVTVNSTTGKIYWVDRFYEIIYEGNVDGSGSPVSLYSGLNNPHQITIDEATNQLYWTEDSALKTAPADGSGIPQILYSDASVGRLRGIAVRSSSTIFPYSWNPSFNLSDTTVANPYLANPGIDTSYILTVTSPEGCVAMDTVQIGVFDGFDITGRDTTICEGESVDLSTLITGTPNGTLEYGTSFGTYDMDSSVVSPTMTTTYFVRDSLLNCADTAMIIVTILSPTAGTETYSGCAGDGYSIDVNGVTYDESNPTGMQTLIAANDCDSIVTITLNYLPDAVGTETYAGCTGDGYSVTVNGVTYDESNPMGMQTLTASNGCDSVVTVNLTFNATPMITGQDISICAGGTVDLSTLITGTPVSSLEYGTSFGTYDLGSSIVSPTMLTTYFLRDSLSTCSDTAQITVDVMVCCPSLTNPSAPVTICEGESIANLSVATDLIGDNIEFVYFNSPQTGDAIYTGGTSLGTTMPVSGIAALTNTTLSGFGTFYVYAIISPTPTDPTCRPFAEIQVMINPLPDMTFALSDSTICDLTMGLTILTGSELGFFYQLRNDTDDSPVGAPVAGTGSAISFDIPALTPAGTYTYNVLAYHPATGCSAEITDLAVIEVVGCDFQDYLPTCDNPPCHITSADIFLGSIVSADTSTMGSINADLDDDDGVSFPNNIRPGIQVLFPTTIFNNTGNDAYLTGWVDWNGDQDFDDPGEQIANEVFDYGAFNGSFQVSIIVNVPSNSVQEQNIAVRYRLSTDPTSISSPCGEAACAVDGEIEDYLIQVECPPRICLPASMTVIRN